MLHALSLGSPHAALSEPPLTAATVFPLHDALINDRKTTHTFSVSTVDPAGRRITLSWLEGPGVEGRFEGKRAKTYLATYTTTINGSKVNVSNDVQYFSVLDNELLGSAVSTIGKTGTITHYSVVIRSRPLPKSARIGDAGLGDILLGYSGTDRVHAVDRRQVSWSLQRDPGSPNDALYCERQMLQYASTRDAVQFATECFHEDPNGTFSAPIEIHQTSTTFH